MAIKLTKNEQKVQKDRLKQYQRYLPTLQLKKQQLQPSESSVSYNRGLYFWISALRAAIIS